MGDVFESILGLYYEVRRKSRKYHIALAKVAEWMDEYVFAVYDFMRSTAWRHCYRGGFQ